MNSRLLRFLLFLLPLVFLTSCFELYEEIKIRRGGGGSVELGFSLGEISNAASLASRFVQPAFMLEISRMPETAAGRIGGLKGISNVRYNQDLTRGKIYVAFDFENSRALNNAYYRMFFRDRRWYEPRPIKVNRCRIKRQNISPVIKLFVGKNQSRISDMKQLNFIRLRSEITTPGPVKSVSNSNYTIIPGENGVRMSIGLQEFLSSTPDTGVRVRY